MTLTELRAKKTIVEEQISELLTNFSKENEVHINDLIHDTTNYRGLKSPPWSNVRVIIEVKV